jgi:hypothetical protein
LSPVVVVFERGDFNSELSAGDCTRGFPDVPPMSRCFKDVSAARLDIGRSQLTLPARVSADARAAAVV